MTCESRRPPQAGGWRAGCRRRRDTHTTPLHRPRRGADRRLPAGVPAGIRQVHPWVRRPPGRHSLVEADGGRTSRRGRSRASVRRVGGRRRVLAGGAGWGRNARAAVGEGSKPGASVTGSASMRGRGKSRRCREGRAKHYAPPSRSVAKLGTAAQGGRGWRQLPECSCRRGSCPRQTGAEGSKPATAVTAPASLPGRVDSRGARGAQGECTGTRDRPGPGAPNGWGVSCKPRCRRRRHPARVVPARPSKPRRSDSTPAGAKPARPVTEGACQLHALVRRRWPLLRAAGCWSTPRSPA